MLSVDFWGHISGGGMEERSRRRQKKGKEGESESIGRP